MNISLLDPFSIPPLPDRIDSTIRFPFQSNHPTNHNITHENEDPPPPPPPMLPSHE